MRIIKSTPLVLFLLKNDIAFISDYTDVVIDDIDYKNLVEFLSNAKKTKRTAHLIALLNCNAELKKPDPIKKRAVTRTKLQESYKRPIPDLPKLIVRPPAVYSNPDYKNLYL